MTLINTSKRKKLTGREAWDLKRHAASYTTLKSERQLYKYTPSPPEETKCNHTLPLLQCEPCWKQALLAYAEENIDSSRI